MLDDEAIMKVLTKAKELGCVVMVHAEHGEQVVWGQNKMTELGINGPEGHRLSRPECVEACATHVALSFATQINTPIYIVHVQSREAAEELIKFRQKGGVYFGEVLATALAVDGNNIFDKDWNRASQYVMSPPISCVPGNIDYMLRLLQTGDLSTTATDNCTFTHKQKQMGKDTFTKIPNGCNGLEDRLSLVWNNGVKRG